jgi:hypothetical protein
MSWSSPYTTVSGVYNTGCINANGAIPGWHITGFTTDSKGRINGTMSDPLPLINERFDQMHARIAKLERKNEELEGMIADQNEFIVTMWHHPTMPGGSNAIRAMEEKYKNKEHSENK